MNQKFVFTIFILIINCQILTAQYLAKNNLANYKSVAESEAVLQIVKENNYDSKLIFNRFIKAYPDTSAYKTIRVLPEVSKNLIHSGKRYERIIKLSDRLLNFVKLQDRIKTLYFEFDAPLTAFTYPYALQISSRTESLLTDDELIGVMAHEVSHLVVQDAFAQAVESDNHKNLRTIEMICDMFAMSILREMGIEPQNLTSGLEKLQKFHTKNTNIEEDGLLHPTIKQRKELVGILIKKFEKVN